MIPEERLEQHKLPQLPECSEDTPLNSCVRIRHITETLGACYSELHKANKDKVWILHFQKFDSTP